MGERLKARWDQRSKDRLERTPPMELLKGDEVSDPDSEGVGDDVEGEEHGEPFEGDLESAGREIGRASCRERV